MRKLLLIILVLSAIAFIYSCHKDDTKPEVTDFDLVKAMYDIDSGDKSLAYIAEARSSITLDSSEFYSCALICSGITSKRSSGDTLFVDFITSESSTFIEIYNFDVLNSYDLLPAFTRTFDVNTDGISYLYKIKVVTGFPPSTYFSFIRQTAYPEDIGSCGADGRLLWTYEE